MTTAPRILIVDDEVPIRRLLRTTLQAQHYEVVEAGNAADALQILKGPSAPALVLLDLGLLGVHHDR